MALPIDDDFDDKRGSEYGGRRVSDAPTVPLRDHLETLIRGVRTELHLEITDVAAKVDELSRDCKSQSDELGRRVHKLITGMRALEILEANRQGGKDARAGTRQWLQWLPSVLAVLIAAYVAFFT